MNITNKILLYIGITVIVSGVYSCYASTIMNRLPKDVKIDSSGLVTIADGDHFRIDDNLANLKSLNEEQYRNFLSSYTYEWLPELFNCLRIEDQENFANQHAQELQNLKIDCEREMSAWKLSKEALLFFNGIKVTVVNDLTVRLSKPLQHDITPELCKAICYYQVTDRGAAKSIFGKNEAAGIVFGSKDIKTYFEYNSELAAKYHQGLILYKDYSTYIVPNISISEGGNVISWNPVLYFYNGCWATYNSFINEKAEKQDSKYMYYPCGAKEDIKTHELYVSRQQLEEKIMQFRQVFGVKSENEEYILYKNGFKQYKKIEQYEKETGNSIQVIKVLSPQPSKTQK